MEPLFKKGNGGLVDGFTRNCALWPLLHPLFSLRRVHSVNSKSQKHIFSLSLPLVVYGHAGIFWVFFSPPEALEYCLWFSIIDQGLV